MYARLDPVKLADVQTVADKLVNLPKDALVYISGYVEGRRDAMADRAQSSEPSDQPSDARPSA